MTAPSSACIERLRQIEDELDNLLSMVANSPFESMQPTQLRRAFFSALDGAYATLDEECIETLRGLEPLIELVGHAVLRGTNKALIERQIARAKAYIRHERNLRAR